MNPFFSVIIPVYNKEKYIAQTIQSLRDQTFKNFEVIVINDGSTDASLLVLQDLIDEKFTIFNQENKGVSQARNYGISKAKSKFIALLDADDFWQKDHLLELKKLIDAFPYAGLFCNNYEINYNGKFVKPANFNFNYKDKCVIVSDYFKSSIINSVAWTSSVAFSKVNFEKIGKFNEALRTGQDIDLWIRFALRYDIAFNPTITMRYNKFDPLSLSKSKYNKDRYRLINGFKAEERQNTSLKLYLDINRYALAIRCKMNNEIALYNNLKNEIDKKNLNFKQKILLESPKFLLQCIKSIQNNLIDKGIYLTAFK